MKPVKLKIVLPIDDRIHEIDEVVMVPDVRAAELVRLGHAEEVDATPAVANPDHNTLADCIDPEPPGGLVLEPFGAGPNVQDHPGLRKAVEIAPTLAVKTAKLKPDQVVEGKPGSKAEAKTTAATTANEIVTPATKVS